MYYNVTHYYAGLSYKLSTISIICASTSDFGTYHVSEKRRRMSVCTYAQTSQKLSSSHTQSMHVDEGSE